MNTLLKLGQRTTLLPPRAHDLRRASPSTPLPSSDLSSSGIYAASTTTSSPRYVVFLPPTAATCMLHVARGPLGCSHRTHLRTRLRSLPRTSRQNTHTSRRRSHPNRHGMCTLYSRRAAALALPKLHGAASPPRSRARPVGRAQASRMKRGGEPEAERERRPKGIGRERAETAGGDVTETVP